MGVFRATMRSPGSSRLAHHSEIISALTRALTPVLFRIRGGFPQPVDTSIHPGAEFSVQSLHEMTELRHRNGCGSHLDFLLYRGEVARTEYARRINENDLKNKTTNTTPVITITLP